MTLLLKPPPIAVGTRDLATMAMTILGEAEGEALPGKVAVGWVIVNRAVLRKQTIDDVCRARLQFSCWNDGSPRIKRMTQATFSDPYYRSSYGVALLILAGEYADPTNGADHYFTIAKPKGAGYWPPLWAKKMVKTVAVGAHTFYRS